MTTTQGGTWLLDLESAGVIQIVGDQSAGADLARFIAAGLALNPWSDAEIVSVVGIAEEVVPLNYGRLFKDPRLDIDRLAKADATDGRHHRVFRPGCAGVARRRLGGRMGANRGHRQHRRSKTSTSSKHAVADLLNEMERTPGRTSVVLVLVASEPVEPRALTLRFHGDGKPGDSVGVRPPEPTYGRRGGDAR